MLLRSGLVYTLSASATANTANTTTTNTTNTTSTRSSRKRKSADDELDARPLKRQETTLVLQGEPSSSSHLTPPVAPPSSSNSPSPLPSSSELPLVGEVRSSPVESAGNEKGSRRVRFHKDVVTYLFEADDEPCRAADHKAHHSLSAVFFLSSFFPHHNHNAINGNTRQHQQAPKEQQQCHLYNLLDSLSKYKLTSNKIVSTECHGQLPATRTCFPAYLNLLACKEHSLFMVCYLGIARTLFGCTRLFARWENCHNVKMVNQLSQTLGQFIEKSLLLLF